jgi:leucyl aminopeptidase
VKEFKEKNIPVEAVMHMDMTGYKNASDDKTIWFISDNVNRPLTDYLETLATTYAGVTDVKETSCGYGCSDHASWTKGGYIAAMPSESKFSMMNPDIHSSNDTMYHNDGNPKLDKNHMLKYVKLATSFIVEMAQPA